MKQKLYLDTSVLSAYYDNEKIERQELTKEFWKILENYEIYISTIVIKELEQTKDNELKSNFLNLVEGFKKLEISDEATALGDKYLENKIFPERFADDAYHTAVASVNNIDYLVSWNFKHLVKIKTRRLVNLVNLQNGYKSIEIIAPPEL